MSITSQVKYYPFELPISINNKNSAILCEQVRSLDWKKRKTVKITTIDDELLEAAIAKFSLLIEQSDLY